MAGLGTRGKKTPVNVSLRQVSNETEKKQTHITIQSICYVVKNNCMFKMCKCVRLNWVKKKKLYCIPFAWFIKTLSYSL